MPNLLQFCFLFLSSGSHCIPPVIYHIGREGNISPFAAAAGRTDLPNERTIRRAAQLDSPFVFLSCLRWNALTLSPLSFYTVLKLKAMRTFLTSRR